MLWIGVEVLNGSESVMWRGQINNDKEWFYKLLEKLKLIEYSNDQSIGAIFMNPTGNYHVPLKAFLEEHYRVMLVDARVSEQWSQGSLKPHIRSQQRESLGRSRESVKIGFYHSILRNSTLDDRHRHIEKHKAKLIAGQLS